MKLLKFILSLETFFCSSCFLAIFSPENQKREWRLGQKSDLKYKKRTKLVFW
ncbi:hypothetical protein HMPREF0813_00912 [Streptococcus anginosus F0211]|uniref:Uncharacterized protein n=1 Tax=Streptococcus anginosus F0211 TaxID=706437 RepID=E6J0Y9_STRAP|nr:hypothetical protein HMPREF0813_00912 [Streptococcus anginosus F0211]